MSDALIDAIESGDVDRVAKLLAAGEDPNTTRPGYYTPLQDAVDALLPPGEVRGLDAMVLLLRHGAMVDGRDGPDDSTPLLVAVQRNHIEAVRLLLAAGADPNVRDHRGDSPLRICAAKGYVDVARLLLLCGATKTIDEWGGDRPMTALGLAARDLQVDMAKLLLAYGANPQARDVDDMTPLDCLKLNGSPEDPADQERLREIRQLLGDLSE